jgi:hypothetical protein
MEYSGAGGKLIHEKNQKQKISWHCPFKRFTNSVSVPVKPPNEVKMCVFKAVNYIHVL